MFHEHEWHELYTMHTIGWYFTVQTHSQCCRSESEQTVRVRRPGLVRLVRAPGGARQNSEQSRNRKSRKRPDGGRSVRARTQIYPNFKLSTM